jgi:hypothetical protein
LLLFDIENPEKFRFSCRAFGEDDGDVDRAVIDEAGGSVYERCFSYLKIWELGETGVYRQFNRRNMRSLLTNLLAEMAVS